MQQRWTAPVSWFWQDAPLFRVLMPLVAAITSYHQQLIPLSFATGLFTCLLTLLIVGGVLHFKLKKGLLPARISTSIWYLFFFLAGWLLCFEQDIRNQPSWLGHHLNRQGVTLVRVTEDPAPTARTWRMRVEAGYSFEPGKTIPVCGEAMLFLYKDTLTPNIRKGDILLVPSEWDAVRNSTNPFSFDYAAYCARNQCYHQQFVSGDAVLVVDTSQRNQDAIDVIHARGMSTLERFIPDTLTLGIMQAMLLGDDLNLDEDARQAFSETGIIHIIAISGSHLSFLFLLITFLFRWIKHKKYRWIPYVVAIPAIWFYVLIAGAPVSAMRAAVMFTLVGLAFIFNKEKTALNTLLGSAVALLLTDPNSLYAVGFQLSFIAVLSLILFYRPVERIIPITSKILKPVWSVAAASIAAEILVAPLVAYYFHLFPIGFIMSNILAWLIMSLLMILGILLFFCPALPTVGFMLGKICFWLVHLFSLANDWFRNWNPEALRHLQVDSVMLALMYLVIGCVAISIARKNIRWLLAGQLGTIVLCGWWMYQTTNALQQERLIVYDLRKAGYAEYISGSRHYPLFHRSIDSARWKYAVDATHTGLMAWRQGALLPDTSLVFVGGKSVLFLREKPTQILSAPIRTDYLVITYPLKRFDLPKLQQIIEFDKLVIASHLSRYYLQQWQDSVHALKMPTHFVQTDGAFVLSR